MEQVNTTMMKDDRARTKIEFLFKERYREFCLLSYGYVSNMDMAEDIVQDIFVKVLGQDADSIANLEGYLWMAIRNQSIKHQEKSKKHIPIKELEIPLVFSEDEIQTDSNLSQKIRLAMAQLPEQCKRVFELCALEGEKYGTAAEIMGISVNTVKTQMKKAYRILRIELRNVYLLLLLFTDIHLFFS